MDDQKTAELKQRLVSRLKFDRRCEMVNFLGLHVLITISVLASFGTAIVAALNVASPTVLAILASIPGTAIIIDKSFRLADRWRWHNSVANRFAALEQSLTIEGKSVEEVSKAMTDFLCKMEAKYPAHSRGVLHDTSTKAEPSDEPNAG